ncbi:MAG: hypothetical protein RR054_01535 [Clostridia bacterium]
MLEEKEIEALANETRVDLDENEMQILLINLNKIINHAKWMKLVKTDGVLPTTSSLDNVYDDESINDELKLFENKNIAPECK